MYLSANYTLSSLLSCPGRDAGEPSARRSVLSDLTDHDYYITFSYDTIKRGVVLSVFVVSASNPLRPILVIRSVGFLGR